MRVRMVGVSWNSGCPMDPADLVLIQMSHDNRPHTGTLIIHRNLVADIIDIFAELYRIQFPIERMRPYEEFGVGKYGETMTPLRFIAGQATPTSANSACIASGTVAPNCGRR